MSTASAETERVEEAVKEAEKSLVRANKLAAAKTVSLSFSLSLSAVSVPACIQIGYLSLCYQDNIPACMFSHTRIQTA